VGSARHGIGGKDQQHAESQEADHIETADFAARPRSSTAHVLLLTLGAICIDRADFGFQITLAQKAASQRQHQYTADLALIALSTTQRCFWCSDLEAKFRNPLISFGLAAEARSYQQAFAEDPASFR
jgi:hypothetical protein